MRLQKGNLNLTKRMNLEIEKNDYYWKLLQFEVQEKKIAQVFEMLEENNFEPVLIKGWAAARNYPRPFERLAVDIDLAVNPKDYAECRKFLREKKVTGIDLHKGLRHLETLDWKDLFGNTRLVKIENVDIRILAEEDHLRVLCVHWLNDGGANRERLWDIFYAVENRRENFDWKRCLDAVNGKRKNWIICAIALAEKYLELDLSKTPIAAQPRKIPAWLIKTVEKEWKRDIKLKPLESCFNDKIEFLEQIKIRIPPNPIQSTIEMEGEFDESPRIFYQFGGMLMRIRLSLKRVSRKISGNR